MPTYIYKREDGTTFEKMQRITEEPLTVCPITGQKVKRVIGGGAGLIFKGEGFYLTDYARKSGGSEGDKSDEGGSADASSSTSEKTDTKASSKETNSSDSS